MCRPCVKMYLFHLHFYVNDPQKTEQAFVDHVGMRVVGRAGFVGSEQIGFSPEAGWEAIAQARVRFRQTQLQRGAFDLILGPGNHPEPRLEYFGMRVEKVRFAVSDLAACERFFSDVLGNDAWNQFEFERSSDNQAFRPVEVRLSSTHDEDKTAIEIPPSMRWLI